jgi:hypothetical protein
MKRYTRIILGLAAPITFAVIAVSLPAQNYNAKFDNEESAAAPLVTLGQATVALSHVHHD